MAPRRFAEENRARGVSARSVVAELPNTPGVYRFRYASERVLYRGARLISDVASARTGPQPEGRLAEMVRRIARIEAVIWPRTWPRPRPPGRGPTVYEKLKS